LFSQIALWNESYGPTKSNGIVEISHEGQTAAVDFDFIYKSDTDFTLEFSAPLGMVAASVRYKDNQTYAVDLGDTQHIVLSSDFVDIGHGILKFPLTWSEFIAFFTGHVKWCGSQAALPDSVAIDKGNTRGIWRGLHCLGKPMDIIASADNKSTMIHEILYRPSNTPDWSVTFGQIRKSQAKEIKFVLANNNYFYVKYRSVKYLGTKGK